MQGELNSVECGLVVVQHDQFRGPKRYSCRLSSEPMEPPAPGDQDPLAAN